MSYVIDASVVVKMLVREEGSEQAFEVLRHPAAAPDVLVAECLNALRRKVLRGEINRHQALFAVAVLNQAQITLEPSRPLAQRALELSLHLSHPIYDCLYLALAERRDVPLITADQKLVNRCQRSDALDLARRVHSLYSPLPLRVQERTFRPYMARRRA